MSRLNKYLEASSTLNPYNKSQFPELENILANKAKQYDPNPYTADSAQARIESERRNEEIEKFAKDLYKNTQGTSYAKRIEEIIKRHNIRNVLPTVKNEPIPMKEKEKEPMIGIPWPAGEMTFEDGKKMIDELIRRNTSPQAAAKLMRGKGITQWMQGKLLKYMVGKLNE